MLEGPVLSGHIPGRLGGDEVPVPLGSWMEAFYLLSHISFPSLSPDIPSSSSVTWLLSLWLFIQQY